MLSIFCCRMMSHSIWKSQLTLKVTAAKKILMNVVNWGPTSRCLCRSSASHILRRSLVEIRRRRVRQAATYATGVYMCGYTDTVKWDEEVIEIEASVTPSLYEKWKGGRGQSSMELLSQRGVTGMGEQARNKKSLEKYVFAKDKFQLSFSRCLCLWTRFF